MLICKSTKLPSLALENSQPQFSIQSNSRENNILAIWMPFQKGEKNHLALAGWLRNRHAAINAATKPRPHLRGELACRWNNAMLIQTPKSVTIHPLASECKFPVPVCSIQSKLSVENYTTMNKAHQSLQNDHCTILFDFGPAQHHETRAWFTFRTSQVSSSWTRGGRFVGCQWPAGPRHMQKKCSETQQWKAKQTHIVSNRPLPLHCVGSFKFDTPWHPANARTKHVQSLARGYELGAKPAVQYYVTASKFDKHPLFHRLFKSGQDALEFYIFFQTHSLANKGFTSSELGLCERWRCVFLFGCAKPLSLAKTNLECWTQVCSYSMPHNSLLSGRNELNIRL